MHRLRLPSVFVALRGWRGGRARTGARSALTTALALALIAVAPARLARADDPGPVEIYAEVQPDGAARTVGRWSDGSYTIAVNEYPETRPDGTTVYVFVWNTGVTSVLLREYPETGPDGSTVVVREWEGGAAPPAASAAPALAAQPEEAAAAATAVSDREAIAAFAVAFREIQRDAGNAIDAYNKWLPTLSGKPGSRGALEWGYHRTQRERIVQRLNDLQTPPEAASIRDDYREGHLASMSAMEKAMENWRSGGAIACRGCGDDIRRGNELRAKATKALDELLFSYGIR